jgi:hypothetical protein
VDATDRELELLVPDYMKRSDIAEGNTPARRRKIGEALSRYLADHAK